MTTTNQNQQRIAIIGGGPGGLTLALILQRNGIPSVIYEREREDKSHERGGSLDIHEDSGQQALKEAGLYDEFQQAARYEGEDFRLFDKTGKAYIDEVVDEEVPGGHGRPEIDRGVLCDLLLSKIDPAIIRFGYKLDKAVSLPDGTTELHFQNGIVETADLVIGADGAFSRVRPLLSNTDVSYSGLTMLELNVIADLHPDLAAFNHRGKMFALDDNKGILGQLNGDGRIKVYASFKAERHWIEESGIRADQPQEAKKQLLKIFKDWDESLQNYIRYAEDSILPRRIYMLPVGFTWQRNQGVTLIGDAAHVMSPFAGEGVNLAMQDAMELAVAIVRNKDQAKAIEEYEEKMYEYSSEKARESNDNLILCFSENAARKLSDLMNSYLERSNESVPAE
ncbi:2-polyprenyl-6-methoxyphenol hydroxylase [Paenibacillus sp. UNC496MF]|uniref:FAD-dependent oxidoreductase n=1 Tax=Paenibacillus sp. UNC496MF TaxID=1502753 RepID=UPI0008E832BA|nr:NAD(P)/FAD-dependent oxidoreductase [Paenibacillus sp. UNC496MF]SFJ30474.1 2-polyprenyl-6-methoxyphenol hydroxylase [Paenibacillus sp. UNC496MF]